MSRATAATTERAPAGRERPAGAAIRADTPTWCGSVAPAPRGDRLENAAVGERLSDSACRCRAVELLCSGDRALRERRERRAVEVERALQDARVGLDVAKR